MKDVGIDRQDKMIVIGSNGTRLWQQKQDILFHSGNRKTRPPPPASASGHNRSVNRLRRANEKCMTEQSLCRLDDGLLCCNLASSNMRLIRL